MTDDSRRRFLARFAAASATAYVAPQILTMERAGADTLTSPPPQRPGAGQQKRGNAWEAEERDVVNQGPAPANVGQWHDLTTEGYTAGGNRDPAVALPRTGANVADEAIAGAGLLAAGTSMWLWSADDE